MSSPADPLAAALDPEQIIAQLTREFPRAEQYWVAYSGGLDSSMLLHLLADHRDRLSGPLSAIHVDHALQPGSRDWTEHCRRQCARRDIPITALTVDAGAAPGESPEAAARAARYAAIAEVVGPAAMLLTAHHQDDQAETLLLQLLRGAGVDGLAAMPAVRAWHGGWLARPLLGVQRKQIHAWARSRQLSWIEDPSNKHTEADRNFLRRQVMPLLAERWPSAGSSLAHSAALCADAAAALRREAATDFASLASADQDRLDVTALCDMGEARAREVIRFWLRCMGVPPIPSRRLHEALAQFCQARDDAQVEIDWNGYSLRRFRRQIWLVGKLAAPGAGLSAWTGEMRELGPGLGRLHCIEAPGGIDPQLFTTANVQIGYRIDGLRCRPAGRAGTRSFKKIAQEHGIPPWLRDRLPVIFVDGQPAAIPNCCICEPFAVHEGVGLHPRWIPAVALTREAKSFPAK